MSLAALQQQFQDYVLRGTPGIDASIEPGRLADRERRLAIYHDAYRLRLVEALGADFDALKAVLGPEAFEHACRAYVEATPSGFRNVRWYGGGLAAFLRAAPPWRDRPWLADIAHFEWALTLAFDAADAPPVHFTDLRALEPDAWGTLGFRLHPSARTIRLRANAPALRMAVDRGVPIPQPALAEQPSAWLIWRKDLAPHFRSLPEAEAWALDRARSGASFPEICEGLCDRIAAEEAAATAASWLRTWVDDQLIAALTRVE